MSMSGGTPQFLELDRREAIELLEANHTGRLAFTLHDRVDIEPISYVYAEGWLYARTSPGAKLTTVQHHPWVAFEVDEIADRYDWRSVVVRGTIYFMSADGGDRQRENYEAAVEILRSAEPEAMTEADVTPHRQVVFRIHVDEVTGRAARPG